MPLPPTDQVDTVLGCYDYKRFLVGRARLGVKPPCIEIACGEPVPPFVVKQLRGGMRAIDYGSPGWIILATLNEDGLKLCRALRDRILGFEAMAEAQ